MAFGLGRLRLASREFWATTPAELAAAAEMFAQRPGPPERVAMATLMRRFPDRP